MNVAVIMGGQSAEHDVSVNSGRMVLRHLNRDRYRVKPVRIDRDGQWMIPAGYLEEPGTPLLDYLASPVSAERALEQAAADRVDVAFLTLHGPFGEDGTVQGLLELAEIPYTGSGVGASSLAIDKVRTKELVAYHGILIPPHRVFLRGEIEGREEEVIKALDREFGWPVVLKAPELGSSIGMGIAKNEAEAKGILDECLRFSSRVMAEKFIPGREVTCGVLGRALTQDLEPLPPTEIIPLESEFFDYQAKYTPGASNEITPAPIGEELTGKLQQLACRVHEIVGCDGLSRSDFILDDQDFWFLEINTIPGMTETSLCPQAAETAGIGIPALLDRMVRMALESFQERKRFRNGAKD